jgi:hypothetical protein
MASTLAARVAQHDREIAAIRKLMLAGMKMLAKHDQNFLRIEAEQLALRKDQRRTEKTLERFIRSMERGRNGHT